MLPSFSEIARISKCTMVYFLISKSRQSELSGTFFCSYDYKKNINFFKPAGAICKDGR